MTPHTTRIVSALGLALALGACDKQPQAPASMPFAEPGVTFKVTQASPECDGKGNYRADVAWQVPETQPARLEIQVDQAKRNVFARSDNRSGSEQTGAWVAPGLAFYLLDRESGKVLAAAQAPAARCGSDSTQ